MSAFAAGAGVEGEVGQGVDVLGEVFGHRLYEKGNPSNKTGNDYPTVAKRSSADPMFFDSNVAGEEIRFGQVGSQRNR